MKPSPMLSLLLPLVVVSGCRQFEGQGGFVALFPEDGVPTGWAVRAWDDVRNPAQAGPRAATVRDNHGLGLVVMRERAEALGGTLRAGLDGDEWRVCAVMPGSNGA